MCCSLHQNTVEEKQLFLACITGDLDTVKTSRLALRVVRDYYNYEYSPSFLDFSPLHCAAWLVL